MSFPVRKILSQNGRRLLWIRQVVAVAEIGILDELLNFGRVLVEQKLGRDGCVVQRRAWSGARQRRTWWRGGGSTPGGGVVGDEIPGGRLGTGGRFCAYAISRPIVNVESAKINDAKAGTAGSGKP